MSQDLDEIQANNGKSNDHEQGERDQAMNHSTAILEQALQTARETEQIGIEIMAELNEQNKKLNHINENLGSINQDIRSANRLIKKIERRKWYDPRTWFN
jgi:predicted glutamine amidotransferase